jgi:hypothetical protein
MTVPEARLAKVEQRTLEAQGLQGKLREAAFDGNNVAARRMGKLLVSVAEELAEAIGEMVEEPADGS